MGKYTFNKDEVHQSPLYIEYKGIFDLEGLYRLIIGWLQSRTYEYHEKIFKHKPGIEGKEQEWKMEAWKKYSPYIRFWFDIYVRCWDFFEVELEKNGEKQRMIKGRVRIELKTSIERDWQKTWRKNDTLLRLRGFYDKYVIWKDMQNVWGDILYYQEVKMQNEIKTFLGMETPARNFYHYMGGDLSG